MKTIFQLLTVVLFATTYSCNQEKEKTELDSILDKIEKGDANESDIEELFESISNEKGTATISLPEAKFKITFPVTDVKESSTTQIIDGQEVEVFHHTANMQGRDDENLAYQLDYVFLSDILNEDDSNELFNEQRDYVLSATNSKLEFEKIIEENADGVCGRHLYLTVDDSNIKVNHKMYFKNGIFYMLSVVTEEGHLFNKAISKFLDSFTILD